jgi:phasin family protein
MNYTADHFAAANKANVETLASLTNQAFAGFEKLVELNIAASKAALSESFSHAHAVLAAKDAQELLALQSGAVQPLTEKSAAYSRHLYNIASTTGAEFTKALESKMAEAQQSVSAMVESALKNAPAGSDSAIALFKSAMTASQNAIESAQNAARQAVEVAETNFTAVTNQAVNAASTATKKR